MKKTGQSAGLCRDLRELFLFVRNIEFEEIRILRLDDENHENENQENKSDDSFEILRPLG